MVELDARNTLIEEVHEALKALEEALQKDNRSSYLYHRGFLNEGKICHAAIQAIEGKGQFRYSRKNDVIVERLARDLGNILVRIEKTKSRPYLAWKECQTVSEHASHVLYVMERAIRALLKTLTLGAVKRGRHHQFFQGSDRPQAIIDAITKLKALPEKIDAYLNPDLSSDNAQKPTEKH
ncbi:MAG: hypothetical protein P1U32_02150 [Legionellaceae bacterium]|nr:hypothetical protein [Legionellaceae bacterium]